MNRSIQITALVRQKAIIPHADFPDLLQAFLDTDDNSKRTQALEASGYALRTNTQMKWDKLESFIKDVCRWGDYAGVYGRVLNPKNNPRSKIELKVRSAISLLNSTPPDLIGALESMTEIKHLGVSFASKHLRCLFPEYCPVLDSILRALVKRVQIVCHCVQRHSRGTQRHEYRLPISRKTKLAAE